jgi:glycyl-radical enzyme activating protein
MDRPELNGGYLFDIQGFSVHDGPGCRTLVFFKGCSLSCDWCSNPEGIRPYPEPLYNSSKCISDHLCVDACVSGAIQPADGKLQIDRERCRDCTTYDCARACLSSALRIGGYFISIAELLDKIRRDRQYWGPEGGITLTGGEPFLQPAFAREILERCYEAMIHTGAETCGNVPWENIGQSLHCLDWIFYDLKHLDPEKHRLHSGAGNGLILQNAERLAREFKGRLVFRMPVIPGYNDDPDHLEQVASFISGTGREEINILPVHHLGREKHGLTGRSYYTQDCRVPPRENLAAIRDFFESRGIRCYTGSDTPF